MSDEVLDGIAKDPNLGWEDRVALVRLYQRFGEPKPDAADNSAMQG